MKRTAIMITTFLVTEATSNFASSSALPATVAVEFTVMLDCDPTDTGEPVKVAFGKYFGCPPLSTAEFGGFELVCADPAMPPLSTADVGGVELVCAEPAMPAAGSTRGIAAFEWDCTVALAPSAAVLIAVGELKAEVAAAPLLSATAAGMGMGGALALRSADGSDPSCSRYTCPTDGPIAEALLPGGTVGAIPVSARIVAAETALTFPYLSIATERTCCSDPSMRVDPLS
jgi:hypothetical protein